MLIRRRVVVIPSLLEEIYNLPKSIDCKGLISENTFEANPRNSSHNLIYGDKVEGETILKHCCIWENEFKYILEPYAEYIGTEVREQHNGYTHLPYYRLLFRYHTIRGISVTTRNNTMVRDGGVIVFTAVA